MNNENERVRQATTAGWILSEQDGCYMLHRIPGGAHSFDDSGIAQTEPGFYRFQTALDREQFLESESLRSTPSALAVKATDIQIYPAIDQIIRQWIEDEHCGTSYVPESTSAVKMLDEDQEFDLADLASRIIKAERERCAKIADRQAETSLKDPNIDWRFRGIAEWVLLHVAKRIRSGK